MARKATAPRHPQDWYVEPAWSVELLADHLSDRLIGRWLSVHSSVWDPACGGGTIPQVFARRGFTTIASDIVDRGAPWFNGLQDFLAAEVARPAGHAALSIITNPPYRHTEAFVRQALRLATRFVAVLVPVSWLCSITRFPLFEEHPPLTIAYLSNRPSMPPGDLVTTLGDRAFKNGKVCYCWVIWDVRQRNPMTRSIWLRREVAA